MKSARSLADLSLDGRNVLLRLDLNVPLAADGRIAGDARLRAALDTIRAIQTRGARLAVAAHLGRAAADGAAASLEPVGARLSELLDQDVVLAEDCVGDGVRSLLRALPPGQVVLLENLRRHPGEETNDPEFARDLAAPFDAFVNDAFGAAHRAHASIVGVPRYVRDAAMGPLMAREVAVLGGLRGRPASPYVALIGGSKVGDKIGLLGALLPHVDVLCLGGAMAYTFMAARGLSVGDSPVDRARLRLAGEILTRAGHHDVTVLLPEDHVCARTMGPDAEPVAVAQPEIPAGLRGLDIGPATRGRFDAALARARTALWNGPMGVCEWPAFAGGTHALAVAMARCGGLTVVGGGDSVAAVEAAHAADRIDHLSTGGGASLAFLEHGTLVGLDALARP